MPSRRCVRRYSFVRRKCRCARASGMTVRRIDRSGKRAVAPARDGSARSLRVLDQSPGTAKSLSRASSGTSPELSTGWRSPTCGSTSAALTVQLAPTANGAVAAVLRPVNRCLAIDVARTEGGKSFRWSPRRHETGLRPRVAATPLPCGRSSLRCGRDSVPWHVERTGPDGTTAVRQRFEATRIKVTTASREFRGRPRPTIHKGPR